MEFFDDENDYMPQFSFGNDDGRGKIKKPATTSKFRPGDDVYLRAEDGKKEGPYKVASVPEGKKYTLSLASGELVKGDSLIGEESLVFA